MLGIIEMLTVDLIFLMFAGGAVAAMSAALLGAPVAVQVLVFTAVSVALLFLARPPLKDWMARTSPETLTNAQALVGAEAVVVAEVTENGGRVKLRGEVWSARAAIDNDIIPVDDEVIVTRIDGAIAVVQRQQFQY